MDAAIHDDVKEAGEDAEEADEVVLINAFDLINTCGGTALNRMFETAEETSSKRIYRSSMVTVWKDLAPIVISGDGA